jgi:hypothetical protein
LRATAFNPCRGPQVSIPPFFTFAREPLCWFILVEMNTGLPSYFTQGYLRGKFGNCPKCTVHTRKGAWIRVQKLRAEYLLVPTKKWGVPVYPLQGNDLLRIYARNDSTVLGF